MYSRFAKVFYFLTVLFFIVAFLYIYATLPETVSYEVNERGGSVRQISRDTFFFIAIASFVVLNFLIILSAKMIENQAVKSMRRLFKVGDPLRDQMLSWIYSFIGILNISLIIMAFQILQINNQSGVGSGELN